MCKHFQYILPCGHTKYSHTLTCGYECRRPVVEDYELEWTTTCAECLDKAKEATRRELLKHELKQSQERFDSCLCNIIVLVVVLVALLLGVHY